MKDTRNKEILRTEEGSPRVAGLPARRSGRLEPVSKIDSLAHEIRDPLTTIMASAELLERGVGSETRRHRLLEAILECSERIAATLSKAQENQPTNGKN